MTKEEYIKTEAKKELARRFFYDYCQLRYPEIYKPDRVFLKTLCDGLQGFLEQNEKQFFIANLPPRHIKSLTGTNLVEWDFGIDPSDKVMTASYNERLSTSFAAKVRDTIDEKKTTGNEVYSDIFPKTKVKYGQASKLLWALEGSSLDNYLATSPTGTATGFGANIVIIDDIIKNDSEAYNKLILEGHWDWFKNTMMQRLEGNDWKVILIMTRWAKDDLAGRIIDKYKDLVQVVQFTAVQQDGSMLCDEILSRASYEIKTQEMSIEIVEANFNQKPIDVQGRLYEGFMTYDELPEKRDFCESCKTSGPVEGCNKCKYSYGINRNYTDTADKGTDFLCSIDYKEFDGDVYVLDCVMSDAQMEETEPEVADMLKRDEINLADIESNNGGRGYRRNIERLSKERGNLRTVFNDINQTSNKEARILSSSAWVQKHVFFPTNWIKKYPALAKQLLEYQKKGKNAHDDGPDVLAGIYERVANYQKMDYEGGVR